MYPNSDAMEVLSPGLPNTECVLLGGDCQCYLPKRECAFHGTHVFFSKKGKVVSRGKKVLTLILQREQAKRKQKSFELRINRITKLIEAIESQE